jgi:hypothetical protein
MFNTPRRVVVTGLLIVSAVAVSNCSSRPDPPATATPSSASEEGGLTPVLSVQELMEKIIDPTADWIFDAAVVDVSTKGTVETKPVSEEDWLKVERGAVLLAEASNLLKMPRHRVPPGTPADAGNRGANAPELSPGEIEAKVNKDRALWNKHADELRTVALHSLTAVKARDSEALFQVGSEIDRACENCHLEYWYPGDRKAVLADQKSRVTYSEPGKK